MSRPDLDYACSLTDEEVRAIVDQTYQRWLAEFYRRRTARYRLGEWLQRIGRRLCGEAVDE